VSAVSPARSSHEPDGTPPREVDWLLADADWVLTCDAAMSAIPSGAVAIGGDTLLGVGSSRDIRSRFRGRNEMCLKGCLVAPGLINTHGHAAMSCFRGLGSDLPLERWLTEVIFPAEALHVTPEFVHYGTLLSCIEMLKGGTTTFCDGYFFEEEAARAAQESGIRAVLGQGILDFPTPDQPDPSRFAERAEAFLRSFPPGESRLQPSLFCHSISACGPETLRRVKSICRESGILFQIHLSETASEVEQVIDRYGTRPVHHLDRLGILDDRTLCAHAVWLDREEIDILAARGAGVSHNEESNMKLASGIAPVPELIAAGVRIGLGTDGCASNNDLDLFSEMDMVAKSHKAFRKDPMACSAAAVLRMATRGGSAVLSHQGITGGIEEGGKADLIVIDLDQPHLTPLYDPISHLVYSAGAGDVRHVWVDGRLVVSNGTILTLDESRIMKEVLRIAGKIAGTS